MKKLLLSLIFIGYLNFPVIAETIQIDLEKLPAKIYEQTRIDNRIISSELDSTYLLAFVENWRDNEKRKKELFHLCSEIIPALFAKYPEGEEIRFNSFVRFTSRDDKKEVFANVFEISLTREEAQKMNWSELATKSSENQQKLAKNFKTLKFKNF